MRGGPDRSRSGTFVSPLIALLSPPAGRGADWTAVPAWRSSTRVLPRPRSPPPTNDAGNDTVGRRSGRDDSQTWKSGGILKGIAQSFGRVMKFDCDPLTTELVCCATIASYLQQSYGSVSRTSLADTNCVFSLIDHLQISPAVSFILDQKRGEGFYGL